METQIAGDSLPLKFIATGTKTGLPKPLEMMYEKGKADYKAELLKKVKERKEWYTNAPNEEEAMFEDGARRALDDVIKLIKGE